MINDFELTSHTADIKMQVYGKSLEQLFSNAVIGMFQSIGPHSNSCRVIHGRLECSTLPCKRTITIQSPDIQAVLVDFLSEALYLSDVYNEAYLAVTILNLSQKSINAILYGVTINRFDLEIKAVTYNDLSIEQINGQWQATIVFDI